MRSFGFEVSAVSTESDAYNLMQQLEFDLLVLGHSLGSSAVATRLAKAFRSNNPRGRVVEIAHREGMTPLNNPDATVVGMDGGAVLRSVLEQQLEIVQGD